MFKEYGDYLPEAEGKVQTLCFRKAKFFITEKVILFMVENLESTKKHKEEIKSNS